MTTTTTGDDDDDDKPTKHNTVAFVNHRTEPAVRSIHTLQSKSDPQCHSLPTICNKNRSFPFSVRPTESPLSVRLSDLNTLVWISCLMVGTLPLGLWMLSRESSISVPVWLEMMSLLELDLLLVFIGRCDLNLRVLSIPIDTDHQLICFNFDVLPPWLFSKT